MARRLDIEAVRRRVAKSGLSEQDVSDQLDELCDTLGVTGTEAITFGEASTPVGKRMMAGSSSVLTHFWDADDGWQKMPRTFSIKESVMKLRVSELRRIIVTEVRRLSEGRQSDATRWYSQQEQGIDDEQAREIARGKKLYAELSESDRRHFLSRSRITQVNNMSGVDKSYAVRGYENLLMCVAFGGDMPSARTIKNLNTEMQALSGTRVGSR